MSFEERFKVETIKEQWSQWQILGHRTFLELPQKDQMSF